MTIGERIKALRIERGMSQDELAKEVGYKTRSAINKIELNERDIKHSQVITFANALGTTPHYLMGWEFPKPIESNIAASYDNSTYMIPLFHDVAAGFGSYADSQVVEFVPVYVESPCKAKNMIAIRVRGDSMYPKIEDGDTIIVYKTDEVDSGSIAVVLIDGDDAVVKKLEYDKKRAVLISINPEYQDRIFEGEEMKRLRVVGRVMKIMKDC